VLAPIINDLLGRDWRMLAGSHERQRHECCAEEGKTMCGHLE
jgi:hypothetical protein